MIGIFIFSLLMFGVNLRSMAGCKSDCREEYESEIQSCKDMYDDPEDADMLKTCMDDANNQFQSCMNECEN